MKKNSYETPIVEVVEVVVECGFAVSSDQDEVPWENM